MSTRTVTIELGIDTVSDQVTGATISVTQFAPKTLRVMLAAPTLQGVVGDAPERHLRDLQRVASQLEIALDRRQRSEQRPSDNRVQRIAQRNLDRADARKVDSLGQAWEGDN